jgi:tight adherence protein B
MSDLRSLCGLALAGGGGGLAALAARDALTSAPRVAAWLTAAVMPLRRAAEEGYMPSEHERRRLALLASGLLGALALAGFGPGPVLVATGAGPLAATWALGVRHRRYRREVERGLPAIAVAVADGLIAGRSVRGALGSAAQSLEGPAAAELARLRADLGLGASLAATLATLRGRLRSPRVDAFAAAISTHEIAGGDLAGLLRRFAAAAAERDRLLAEARSATAQARLTGVLVVALPAAVGTLAEFASPGFIAGLVSNPASVTLIGVAAALQAAGFTAIRRLSRIES